MASSPMSEFIADPIKCCLLSVDEKRELVRELSKYPDNALELLHEWTRRDIVQILCSVFRKGRTFNGASKQEILNFLIKAVNGKSSGCRKRVKESDPEPKSSNLQCPYKKQKKNAVPVVPVTASTPVTDGVSAATNKAHLCQNSACRAGLNPADKFCRCCSCCICLKYDDNKDPSLWLFCDSDQPSLEESCGLSCHLECGFKDERSGILQRGQSKKLDGGYYCIHCGKQNDLLRCWKKQMLIAKDARRLDVLCHRILSHKILISTEKYMVLHEFVDKAMKKLEGEFGPITGLPDMGRRLVGRLAVAVEVQKLCSCAIETLESMFSGALTADLQIQRSSMVPSNFIKLEDISHGSITVVFDLDICPTLPQGLIGFNLWRRKASIEDYPSKPTGIILMPSTSLVVRGLAPFTCYVIKVIAFTNSKEVGSWEVRTKTICFPNKVDAKISMAVDAGTDPNNRSLKADSSSDVSNPSSGDVKSDNDCTAYADPNRSLKSHVEYCTNIDILYPEKSSLHCNETTSNSRDLK
ncbi:hypothetical protein BRADI_1g33450v3 [Brachypodium distachyon]|uniref:Fibronectin type-III domain-containing protein n=1 Tax=Brachypodium distachyon TaxID=15368 RepID=A0A2K2DMI5_BRADI|nr:hypothetical protein BRADI_1g33450v3 [Brachypodium distachyon]